MRRTTIAYVDSSRDQTKRHIVIKRGNRFECTCLSFFFAEDRDEPCRHIKSVLKTTFAPSPVSIDTSAEWMIWKKAASVTLTPKGMEVVRDYYKKSIKPIQKPVSLTT